jgi:hypothetical protein
MLLYGRFIKLSKCLWECSIMFEGREFDIIEINVKMFPCLYECYIMFHGWKRVWHYRNQCENVYMNVTWWFMEEVFKCSSKCYTMFFMEEISSYQNVCVNATWCFIEDISSYQNVYVSVLHMTYMTWLLFSQNRYIKLSIFVCDCYTWCFSEKIVCRY